MHPVHFLFDTIYYDDWGLPPPDGMRRVRPNQWREATTGFGSAVLDGVQRALEIAGLWCLGLSLKLRDLRRQEANSIPAAA